MGACAKAKGKKFIGTKWVFKNKLNEERKVARKKERLVCKGYAQIEGVDIDETFAPVARLDEIRMFLDFSCFKKNKFCEMDVKSTFLNGDLEEEVYIEQPKAFLLGDDENQVCRLKSALYGLKQAPRAWYANLDKHIQHQGFQKGSTNNYLYIKFEGDHFLIIVMYVDDIIFGSDLEEMGQNFTQEMQK